MNKNNGVLNTIKNEYRITCKEDIYNLQKELMKYYNDTIKNETILKSEVGADNVDKYEGVGELKIEIKLTHYI